MKPLYALVDCNNFYVSCERLFNPALRDRPVLVLSNNDGCVVARSQEAKALGIKMAVPAFKVADLIKQHDIQVYSSNYALYGDISARVMTTLECMVPSLEVYSIDEAFLNLSGISFNHSKEDFGQQIRQKVRQHVGVPVCIGMAPTKTLAKLANYAAKKYPATAGVVDLTATERQQKLMEITPVEEIWGVGRKSSKKLQQLGIKTALQLSRMDKDLAQRKFSIVMVKTIEELNGEVRFQLENDPEPNKQLICSRSFGEKITDYQPLREAICEFVAKAAERLRRKGLVCGVMNVFIRTSMYNPQDPSYANSALAKLPSPSSDTITLLENATRLFDSIWEDGYRYAKAGVMLGDLCEKSKLQLDLFSNPTEQQINTKLMSAIDQINRSSDKKIWFGGQRPKENWFMNQRNLSPAYTTRWKDLPIVK